MASRADPKFALRIPNDLKDWLQQRARANKRSATSELLMILEEARAASAKKGGSSAKGI